jgi:hypothetical protein
MPPMRARNFKVDADRQNLADMQRLRRRAQRDLDEAKTQLANAQLALTQEQQRVIDAEGALDAAKKAYMEKRRQAVEKGTIFVADGIAEEKERNLGVAKGNAEAARQIIQEFTSKVQQAESDLEEADEDVTEAKRAIPRPGAMEEARSFVADIQALVERYDRIRWYLKHNILRRNPYDRSTSEEELKLVKAVENELNKMRTPQANPLLNNFGDRRDPKPEQLVDWWNDLDTDANAEIE